MVSITINVIDRTNLLQKHKSIVAAAKRGVKLATESGVEWIKGDVFSGQSYVGHSYYPDVKPATKAYKAKVGKENVGIMTGNLVSSFGSSVSGLRGTIKGAGYAEFSSRWLIGSLFMEKRAKRTREIIEGEIKKKI